MENVKSKFCIAEKEKNMLLMMIFLLVFILLSISRLSHEYLTYHFFIKRIPHPAKSKSAEQRIRELTEFTRYPMGSIGVKRLLTWAPFSCTAASNWRACRTFTYILQNETNGMNGGHGDLLTVNIHKALLKSEAHRDEWAPTEKQHKKGPTFMIAHQTHSGSHQATSPWLTKSRDKVVDFMNTCLPALKSNKLRRDDIHSLPNATSKSH